MKKLSNIRIITFALLITLLVFATVFGAYLTIQNDDTKQELPKTLRWSLLKIENNDTVEGTFDLAVRNEMGGVKTIPEVITWGLSNNQTLLASFTTRGLEIHDLNNNAFSVVPIDGKRPSGMIREGISFGMNDLHFTFSAFVDGDSNVREIFVFHVGGELIARFGAEIYHDGGKVANSLMSRNSNLILTRTVDPADMEFTKPDGTAYNLPELPIKLSVFNFTGEKVYSYDVRDYGSADDRVMFKWDSQNQSIIDFVIYNKNKTPDFSDFGIFSKIALN